MRSLPKTLLAALCGSLLLLSAARAQIDPATAEVLVKRSGLWVQLGLAHDRVKDGAKRAAQSSPRMSTPQERARFEQVVVAAYDPARMRRLAVATLAARFDPEALASVKAWYASAAHARLKAADDASGPEGKSPEATLEAGRALMAGMPAARKALLQRAVDASHAVEMGVQMLMSSGYAIERGMRAANPDLPGESPRELRAALEAQRSRYTRIYAEVLWASFADTYRHVADEDLAAYADFMTTKHGAHYNAVVAAAMAAAFDDAAEEMGRNLMTARDKSSS